MSPQLPRFWQEILVHEASLQVTCFKSFSACHSFHDLLLLLKFNFRGSLLSTRTLTLIITIVSWSFHLNLKILATPQTRKNFFYPRLNLCNFTFLCFISYWVLTKPHEAHAASDFTLAFSSPNLTSHSPSSPKKYIYCSRTKTQSIIQESTIIHPSLISRDWLRDYNLENLSPWLV